MFLGHRFADEELEAAAREVFADLGRVPTDTAYIGWARRPDVQARGRRPRTTSVFARLGGLGPLMQQLGLVAHSSPGRYAGLLVFEGVLPWCDPQGCGAARPHAVSA